MSPMDFESIHNFYERPVFEAVAALAQKIPGQISRLTPNIWPTWLASP